VRNRVKGFWLGKGICIVGAKESTEIVKSLVHGLLCRSGVEGVRGATYGGTPQNGGVVVQGRVAEWSKVCEGRTVRPLDHNESIVRI
jgi:hypothetical protein